MTILMKATRSFCTALTLFVFGCTGVQTEPQAESCPEGTVRVADQCKDLSDDGPTPNPGSSLDGSVPVTTEVGDAGIPQTAGTSLPFYLDEHFAASGYMGDAEVPGNLIDTPCQDDEVNDTAHCHRFTVAPGTEGWSGLWWQSPADNWGEVAGLGLLIESGAQKVKFKAWSATGGEVIDFFVGYSSDGFTASKPLVTLTTEPTVYEVDINCYTYQHVAGGFGWSVDTAELQEAANIFVAEVEWTNEANANPIDCVALEEERLSLGVFYDGPFSESLAVDDETRHLYIYEETVGITTSLESFEGALSNTVSYNGLGWWGLGIHWDEADDLSSWAALNLAVRVSAENEFQNMKVRIADAAENDFTFRLKEYGLANHTGWQPLSLPLAEATAAGVDLATVVLPMELFGGGNSSGASFDIDGVFFGKTYSPPSIPVQDGGVASGENTDGGTLGEAPVELPDGGIATMPLLFEDNFDGEENGTLDPNKWRFDLGNGDWGWGNQQLEYNTNNTNNVSTDGLGHLRITAREEVLGSCWNGSACQYTSGRINTKSLFATKYGRIEGRLKMPSGQGLWPAFWMLGANIDIAGWPECGEIDILEYRGQEPFVTNAAIHGPGYSGGDSFHDSYTSSTRLDEDFHVYAVDWEPNLIRWSIDDITFFSMNANQLNGGQTWAFEQPFFLILNLAVGGNYLEDPDETTVFPQTLLVDYVRVYGREGETPTDLEPFCLDVFHEGPCETMFLVDDESRHYYIYSATYDHSSSSDAFQGASSAKITSNGSSWWGGGIHSDSPVDLSGYTQMNVALKADSTGFAEVEIRMEAETGGAKTVKATDYGFENNGTWHALSIPLTDFTGLDLTQIKGLFMLGGAAEPSGAELLVDGVSFE